MDVTSTYKFARISARKARDVAREIQGLPVSDALDILNFTPRKAAELFTKTMRTALADAENNFELPIDGLFVKSAIVGEGPTYKRFKARARGSASAIRKRTSHITVVLSDEVEAPKEEKPKLQPRRSRPRRRPLRQRRLRRRRKPKKPLRKRARTRPEELTKRSDWSMTPPPPKLTI